MPNTRLNPLPNVLPTVAAPHIAVAGQIAAGKSTLVSKLADEIDAMPLLERIDQDPFFGAFREAPTRWAFPHTIFLIEQSMRDQQAAQARRAAAVQERLVQEHIRVFAAEFYARGYITDDEWALIGRLGDTCGRMLQPIDLLIYVDISPNEALGRIRLRGRREEGDIDPNYLTALHARHAKLVEGWPSERVLVLDAAHYDFRDDEDVRRIAEMVRASLARGDQHANSGVGTTWVGQRHTRPGPRTD